MNTAIKVEKLGKAYRLGEIGTGTLSRDLERWWALLRGKEDPFLKIGEANDRTSKGVSDVVWSLKDINFEIQQGDAVGIIGRNGAGKSTLLKVLSRVTSPTIGSIKINGRIASLLEVGTGFHPELTGRENIYLNGAILGMRKHEIKRKFDEIVDFSGVERYIDTPVKRYSSGMYVRLAFAVAAHLESEILIVDEVLAVGDAEFQQKCLGKMGDVSKGEGRTVLFVSHNMASILQLCNSGILLHNGAVRQVGEIKDVIGNYTNTSINTSSSSFSNVNPKGATNFIHSISLVNRFGENVSSYLFNQNVTFSIQLNLGAPNKSFHFGLYLKDKWNQRIASFIHAVPEHLTGQCHLHLELQQGCLLNGEYFVDAEIFMPFIDKVDLHTSILSFKIEDNESSLSRFNNYDMGKFFIQSKLIVQ